MTSPCKDTNKLVQLMGAKCIVSLGKESNNLISICVIYEVRELIIYRHGTIMTYVEHFFFILIMLSNLVLFKSLQLLSVLFGEKCHSFMIIAKQKLNSGVEVVSNALKSQNYANWDECICFVLFSLCDFSQFLIVNWVPINILIVTIRSVCHYVAQI